MRILRCKIVSRELNFSSSKKISCLKLVQRILLHGICIEEWVFEFGFVIPQSTNSWQQVITGAGKGQMMDPDILNGNLIIETSFFNEFEFIGKSCVKLFYI